MKFCGLRNHAKTQPQKFIFDVVARSACVVVCVFLWFKAFFLHLFATSAARLFRFRVWQLLRRCFFEVFFLMQLVTQGVTGAASCAMRGRHFRRIVDEIFNLRQEQRDFLMEAWDCCGRVCSFAGPVAVATLA